jgi:hypothetical protein
MDDSKYDAVIDAKSYARAINAAGVVAGYLYLGSTKPMHGFVRSPKGAIGMFLVPGAGTFQQSTVANGINQSGEVVGYYFAENGVARGFLMIP